MSSTTTPPATKNRQTSLPPAARAAAWNLQQLSLATLVFFVSTIASVFLLEMCLWLAGIGEEEYMKRDPVMGWVMMPGKQMTWRKEGFSIVKINSAGMTDREYTVAKHPDTLRIAVIGDSNIESLQVPRSLNFCRQLEIKLQTKLKELKASGKKIEVMNFGISAYNVGQLYLRLKNLAKQYNPDIIIVSEYVDSTRNLAPDGYGFFRARPNFVLSSDGKLVSDYSKQDEWLASDEGKRMERTSWLREHSHIWGVLSICAEHAQKWFDGLQTGDSQWGAEVTNKKTTFDTASGPASAFGVFIEPEKNKWPNLPSVNLPWKMSALRKWWPVHDALLKEMKSESDSIDAKMILLRLPQVNGYNNVKETGLLRSFAAEHGVPFIDATDIFINSASKREPLFYGPHMTPRGHALLADTVANELSPLLLPNVSK